ncbi:MAG: recombinase family protein [Pseudomonadota bacterium]
MKSIILARVSTREQEEGHSINAQIARLKEYCQRKQFKVLKVFTIIESSTQGDRKEFHQMLAFAKKQKETVAIVCDAVDRFQRSFRETVLLEEYRLKGTIELHFSRENLVINRESSGTQILMWNMAVLMANSYVLSLSDNVKRSINHKIKNGEWIGKAPVGYINTIDPATGKKKVVPDPERAFLVKRIFQEYGQGGRSVREMAGLAKQWGLKTSYGGPMPSSKIHKLIQNPFYYGVMRIKGQILPAKHEPIISKELFDRCQEIRLGWKKKPFKYSDKPFIFRGLIKCAHCGCTITSDLKKEKYVYLHCTKSKGPCEGKRLREEQVLDQVNDIFKGFQIPDDVLSAIKNHLNKSALAKREYHQEAINRIHSEYNLTQKKLERLLDMRLEVSITQSEYDKKCTQLRDRQDELGEDLRRHTEADEKFNTTLLTLFDLASRAYDLFESSKVDQKRQIINLTLSNLALNGTTLEYQKRKPFSDFPKTASCTKMLPYNDSIYKQFR